MSSFKVFCGKMAMALAAMAAFAALAVLPRAQEAPAPGAAALPEVQNESNQTPEKLPEVTPVPGIRPDQVLAITPTPTPPPEPTPEPTVAPQALPGTTAPAKPGTPIYARKREELRIFDPGRGEELSPLQAAAARLAQQERKKGPQGLASMQNLVTFEFKDMVGATEDEILHEAQTRALMSAAARLYFENYFLLGRDLLEPYLRENGKAFIARSEANNRRIVSAKSIGMDVLVSVNLNSLYHDLNEKHFIAKPNLRPTVSVHLNELVEGQPNTGSGGRQRIEQTMEQNLFRPFSRRMKEPPLDADLSVEEDQLRRARFEAQRNGVDVLITGTMAVSPMVQKQILYDPFAFMEASVALKMYRVDTGELLGEVTDRYSAQGTTVPEATRNALDALMARATQQLADRLRSLWGPMMLDEANYRLMISNVTPERVYAVFTALKSLDPSVNVYQKAYYGDVLVVNLNYPSAEPAKLTNRLRQTSDPQFQISPVDKHRLRLDVM